jgi:hypothetical protein
MQDLISSSGMKIVMFVSWTRHSWNIYFHSSLVYPLYTYDQITTSFQIEIRCTCLIMKETIKKLSTNLNSNFNGQKDAHWLIHWNGQGQADKFIWISVISSDRFHKRFDQMPVSLLIEIAIFQSFIVR